MRDGMAVGVRHAQPSNRAHAPRGLKYSRLGSTSWVQPLGIPTECNGRRKHQACAVRAAARRREPNRAGRVGGRGLVWKYGWEVGALWATLRTTVWGLEN